MTSDTLWTRVLSQYFPSLATGTLSDFISCLRSGVKTYTGDSIQLVYNTRYEGWVLRVQYVGLQDSWKKWFITKRSLRHKFSVYLGISPSCRKIVHSIVLVLFAQDVLRGRLSRLGCVSLNGWMVYET